MRGRNLSTYIVSHGQLDREKECQLATRGGSRAAPSHPGTTAPALPRGYSRLPMALLSPARRFGPPPGAQSRSRRQARRDWGNPTSPIGARCVREGHGSHHCDRGSKLAIDARVVVELVKQFAADGLPRPRRACRRVRDRAAGARGSVLPNAMRRSRGHRNLIRSLQPFACHCFGFHKPTVLPSRSWNQAKVPVGISTGGTRVFAPSALAFCSAAATSSTPT